ncbi:MAG: copper resistance protein CopC [Dermabacter sp.]|nr:copper resistance protein CopC [Dermabacter sp.]
MKGPRTMLRHSSLAHRPARLLAALAALVALAAWAIATPALAHDRLLEASPADGSEVLQGEFTSLTLTFSAAPLELGNQVVVTDADGTELFNGEPAVEGMSAVATIEKAPAPGALNVQWRVVSSDGHPITGTLAYTILEDPALAATAPATEGATGEATDSATAEPSAEATVESVTPATSEADQQGGEENATRSNAWLWWIPVGIVGLLAIGLAIWLLSRDQDDDDTSAGSEGSDGGPATSARDER